MTGKALDELMRQNMRLDLRRMRTQGLVHRIVDFTLKRLPDITGRELSRDEYYEIETIVRRAVHEGATDALMEAGAHLVTDYDRHEAGLPPRGPDGWTVEELIAMEKRRIEALYAPITVTVPLAKAGQ